jgi:rhamnose transport system permease protein
VTGISQMNTQSSASPLRRAILRWEGILFAILVAICVFNAFASPYFLNAYNLFDSTQIFSEKAILALSIALIIIVRDIDLSVASIIALVSTVIGWLAMHRFGAPDLLMVALVVGTAAGMLNGLLVTRFAVPAILVTVGTMSLFRGVSYIMVGDGAFTVYPEGFSEFGQGVVFGMVPYEFLAFLVLAVVFGILLHRTVFGRDISPSATTRKERSTAAFASTPTGSGSSPSMNWFAGWSPCSSPRALAPRARTWRKAGSSTPSRWWCWAA